MVLYGKNINCSDYAKTGVEKAAGVKLNAEGKIGKSNVTIPNKIYNKTSSLSGTRVIKNSGRNKARLYRWAFKWKKDSS